jgi:hypothetical protein
MNPLERYDVAGEKRSEEPHVNRPDGQECISPNIYEVRYLRSEVSPKGCVEGRRNSKCDATLVIEYD